MGQIDRIVEKAGQMAGSAARGAGALMGKGRDKVDQMALQAKLSKTHRQLGALVYALHKNGDENEAMVAWYVEEIDRIKARLARYEKQSEDNITVFGVEEAAAEVAEDAMFCGGGGQELPGQ